MPTKERPILFSAPMVRAILSGKKTQTRRVVKPVGNDEGFVIIDYGNGGWPYRSDDGDSTMHTIKRGGKLYLEETPHAFPYGHPGDRLWVKEAWRIGAWSEEDQQIAVDYIDGPDKSWRQVPLTPEGQELFDRLWMQSSDECRRKGVRPDADGNYRWAPGESPLRWRPSIHMPRWASRTTLEITNVHVQRLQDISEADAKAEGALCELAEIDSVRLGAMASHRGGFRNLWTSINGHDSWDGNPWVFVIEFQRVLS